jgi:hypothetical protein
MAPTGRFEHGAAGITEALAGLEVGLFAHHAVAADFLNLAVGVGDDPVPREQSCRHAAFVADGDGVREDVAAFFRVGLLFRDTSVRLSTRIF